MNDNITLPDCPNCGAVQTTSAESSGLRVAGDTISHECCTCGANYIVHLQLTSSDDSGVSLKARIMRNDYFFSPLHGRLIPIALVV